MNKTTFTISFRNKIDLKNTIANRRLLHGLQNVMREVFTLPVSIFCSADHRDLGLDILEDTSTVGVMGSIAALTDFKGTIFLHS